MLILPVLSELVTETKLLRVVWVSITAWAWLLTTLGFSFLRLLLIFCFLSSKGLFVVKIGLSMAVKSAFLSAEIL